MSHQNVQLTNEAEQNISQAVLKYEAGTMRHEVFMSKVRAGIVESGGTPTDSVIDSVIEKVTEYRWTVLGAVAGGVGGYLVAGPVAGAVGAAAGGAAGYYFGDRIPTPATPPQVVVVQAQA